MKILYKSRTLLSSIVTPQTTTPPPLLPSVCLVIENHNKDFYFPIVTISAGSVMIDINGFLGNLVSRFLGVRALENFINP